MDNMKENNLKLFKLYTLAEMAYENHFKNINYDRLYPRGWYSTKQYMEKIEIIAEAIKTNNLIINTPKYQNLIKSMELKKYIKK